jgi:hypothetical protein
MWRLPSSLVSQKVSWVRTHGSALRSRNKAALTLQGNDFVGKKAVKNGEQGRHLLPGDAKMQLPRNA